MVVLLLVEVLDEILNEDVLFAPWNVAEVFSQLKYLLFGDGAALYDDDVLEFFLGRDLPCLNFLQFRQKWVIP